MAALIVHPSVVPVLFVDDLSVQSIGSLEHLEDHFVDFLKLVCSRIGRDGMELSRTKSVFTASSNSVSEVLETGMQHLGISYRDRVKALGAGLGAGTRWNTRVQQDRLKAFRKRKPRFRMLRRAGVDASKLMRTGGTAA